MEELQKEYMMDSKKQSDVDFLIFERNEGERALITEEYSWEIEEVGVW